MKAIGVCMGPKDIDRINEKLDRLLEDSAVAKTKIQNIETNLCAQSLKNATLETEVTNLKIKVIAFGAFFGGASGLGATYLGKILLGF